MQLIRNLFSFSGRISRRQFWLGHAAIFACSALFAVLGGIGLGIAGVLMENPDMVIVGPLVIGGVVSVGALIAETSLAVRRMHDRNGSAVWVMLLVGAVVILNVTLAAQRVLYGEPVFDPLTIGLGVFALVMGGWMVFELGFMPGTRGKNRFDAAPATEANDAEAEVEAQITAPAVCNSQSVDAGLSRA